jgi:hypothetical protein
MQLDKLHSLKQLINEKLKIAMNRPVSPSFKIPHPISGSRDVMVIKTNPSRNSLMESGMWSQ